MAKVVGTVPLPPLTLSGGDWRNSPHEKAFQKLVAESKAIPRGKLVGKLLYFPTADGSAIYRVKSEKPLTLEHVPYGDAWRLEAAHIRGLRVEDVRRMVGSYGDDA